MTTLKHMKLQKSNRSNITSAFVLHWLCRNCYIYAVVALSYAAQYSGILSLCAYVSLLSATFVCLQCFGGDK